MKDKLFNYRKTFVIQSHFHRRQLSSLPARSWHFVGLHETDLLRQAISRGQVPVEFEAKLERLASGRLAHHIIEQSCRLYIALLLAAQERTFLGTISAQRERLLRVLAYVREDDDAIPDSRPDGFDDDLQEVRAVNHELAPLLDGFKHWRLEHQVPMIWLNSPAALNSV